MHKEKYFKGILQTPFSDQYINYMVRLCRERGTFFLNCAMHLSEHGWTWTLEQNSFI